MILRGTDPGTDAVILRWLNALRSGDYKQGQDYLVNGHLYCCLGVKLQPYW